ncbi:MAG: hypothetical protein LBH58_04255 [Tannerellaceae bacterium]|nr:hypothetical protein [Tannerellaceae bacterium]
MSVKTVLLLGAISAMSLTMHAQVTIGSKEIPVAGALLQLKSKEQVSDSTSNSHKGLALPRVTLSDKRELYPMFLTNPDNPASGPNNDYRANKANIDKAHTGLIVYNLVADDEKELCKGLSQWDGKQWICFEQQMGNAVGRIVSCGDISVSGRYQSPYNYSATQGGGVPLDPSNFISMKLEITKPGAYAITAVPEYTAAQKKEKNGYFFVVNGLFLEKGVYTVTLPGSGAPSWYTPSGNQGDKLSITMNGKPLKNKNDSLCVKYIKVEDSSRKPDYVMNCGSVTVHGVYVLNRNLDPKSNYISVWIDIRTNSPSVGGSHVHMETNEVDGIRFVSDPATITSADVAAGKKEIILRGKGKPTSVDTKKMTITSNSAISVASCSASVMVAYTKKKVLSIGSSGGGYGYNLADRTSDTGFYKEGGRKMLNAPINFGTSANSKIKIEGFDFVNGGVNPNAAELQKMIDTAKPDIIVGAYGFSPDEKVVDVLINYMAKKGIVIVALEFDVDVKRLFEKVLSLPSNVITAKEYGTGGSIYTFNYTVNDEILNGPFGNLSGKKWGDDLGRSIGVTGLPPGLVEIYSNGNYNNNSAGTNSITGCRFKGVHLVWFGDGGFWAGAVNRSDFEDDNRCPLYYEKDFSPTTGVYGHDANSRTNIYNSYFFVNMMAWAIKTAQFDGYNTSR